MKWGSKKSSLTILDQLCKCAAIKAALGYMPPSYMMICKLWSRFQNFSWQRLRLRICSAISPKSLKKRTEFKIGQILEWASADLLLKSWEENLKFIHLRRVGLVPVTSWLSQWELYQLFLPLMINLRLKKVARPPLYQMMNLQFSMINCQESKPLGWFLDRLIPNLYWISFIKSGRTSN